MTEIKKNDKKTINAWCMYDWANSVYSLTITTAVFPSYFFGVTGGKGESVNFLGLEINNSVLYTYALSFAFLLVAFQNPFLSAIADIKGNKKKFMRFFSNMGALACTLMFFFDGNSILLGVFLLVFAAMGYAGSLVFYNSYLPEIATEDKFDKISAKGFALGYIGSVILLVINLLMIQAPEIFGITDINDPEGTLAPRISFLMVGIWWFAFSQYTFRYLPIKKEKKTNENIFTKGIYEIKKVWSETAQLPLLRKFLISFFFYSMGVQTVMYLATIFGEEVIGMKLDELIKLVLLLQILAIGGAYGMAWVAKKKGNIFALLITLFLWVIVCISAFFMKEGMVTEYYILGVLVGLVMGGVQSMSRSTYSKLMPQNTTDHASYFSFFETLEKTSIALGTFVYGGILQFTGSMNNSAISMAVFFVIGIYFLLKIPSKSNYNTLLKS
jgi:UMF1 family MFS transporter